MLITISFVAMKYLAFVFSFYLISMILLPCSDAFNECLNTPTKVAAAEHSHKTDVNDNCSPFCTCNCCHSVIYAKFVAKAKETAKPVFAEQQFLLSNQRFVSAYYGNIWQPPKIS